MRHRRLSSARSSLLAERAAAMRRAPSEPEARLFRALSGARLGVALKRQVVLAGFIVDLVAPRAKLVVEVDGMHHAQRRAADARRDRVLERAGWRVVRFTADEVLHELPRVLERIRVEVAARSAVP